MEQRTSERDYEQVINELSVIINSKERNKNRTEKFITLVLELENNFKTKVSKEFLKKLYTSGSLRSKTTRLNYMLNKINSYTYKQNRYFKEIMFKKFNTIVSNWSSGNHNHKKQQVGLVYTQRARKSFNFIEVKPERIRDILKSNDEMNARGKELFKTPETKAFEFLYN